MSANLLEVKDYYFKQLTGGRLNRQKTVRVSRKCFPGNGYFLFPGFWQEHP